MGWSAQIKETILPRAQMWAVVAEWLRRLTRNEFPSGSVGSNPTDCGKAPFFPPKVRFQGNVNVVERTQEYMSASLVQW